jgi:Beta-galactosidase
MRRLAVIVQLLLASLLVGAAPAVALHGSRRPAMHQARRTATQKPRRAACNRKSRNHKKKGAEAGKRCRRLSHRTRTAGPAATSPLIVGLNADVSGYGGASTAARLQQVVTQTGTKWLREEFRWAVIEPEPGVFNFAYYDHFMTQAALGGEHILALLDDAPSWAAPGASAIPANASSYGAFVTAVIDRYGPHGSFWAGHSRLAGAGAAVRTIEIWNEPFFSSGNNGIYDPARYARLVQAAGIAAHAADPSVSVLMAAEMESARNARGDWVWWVDALYQAVPGLNNYFDGVAMHDYGTNTSTLNPMIYGQPYSNYDHMLRIENLRGQFVRHGAANKPFWITEAGWSTCTQPKVDCVTQDDQAANLSTLLTDIHTEWSTWVHAVFIYRYGDGSDPTSVQGGYGLTTLDGTPKPAMAVFRAAALGGAAADQDQRARRSTGLVRARKSSNSR